MLSNTEPTFKCVPCKLNPKKNTRGTVIGPFDKPDLADKDSTWTMAWADKREMYGQENRSLPGGLCKVQHAKENAIKPSGLVPAFKARVFVVSSSIWWYQAR